MNTYGTLLLQAILTHIYYVFVSVLLGGILGVILGIVTSRNKKLAKYLLPLLSLFQTIPGLVFIGILFLYLGMKQITVILALSIYATFPILKNTYVGLLGVDASYIEAARGIGMNKRERLLQVELPLALPSILAGIRMSTIYTVSWAVLASMIGLGGLGDFIYQGTTTNNNTLILIGAIPSAILAILLGYALDVLQKKLTPVGMRKEGVDG